MLGIAIPQAFVVPGGLPGPLIIVTCYVAIRMLHFASFRLTARTDPTMRAQVSRAAVPAVAALALLLYATLTFPPQGRPITPTSAVLWGVALVLDLGGGYLIGPRNWQIRSLDHWVERYNLVVLIAFGEAFISTGVTLANAPISPAVLIAVTLSVTLLGTLWWTYVGTDGLLDRRLRQAPASLRRAALARDAYTYLHLLIVVGLILIAFGLKSALAELAYRPYGGAGARGPRRAVRRGDHLPRRRSTPLAPCPRRTMPAAVTRAAVRGAQRTGDDAPTRSVVAGSADRCRCRTRHDHTVPRRQRTPRHGRLTGRPVVAASSGPDRPRRPATLDGAGSAYRLLSGRSRGTAVSARGLGPAPLVTSVGPAAPDTDDERRSNSVR